MLRKNGFLISGTTKIEMQWRITPALFQLLMGQVRARQAVVVLTAVDAVWTCSWGLEPKEEVRLCMGEGGVNPGWADVVGWCPAIEREGERQRMIWRRERVKDSHQERRPMYTPTCREHTGSGITESTLSSQPESHLAAILPHCRNQLQQAPS